MKKMATATIAHIQMVIQQDAVCVRLVKKGLKEMAEARNVNCARIQP